MTHARASSVAHAFSLFLLGFVPRLVVAHLLAGEPVWDGHYYDFGARRIAGGFGYSDDLDLGGHAVWHPWCHYPVGYSAYLAIFYRVLGATQGAAHLANALVGGLLVVVTWQLARSWLSPRRALVAAVIVALHPGLVLYGALLMTEPLAALLTLSSFAVATRWRTRAGLVAAALVLGVGALVRPQALLCAPFLALALWPSLSSLARRARAARLGVAAAVACVVSLVPVAPWTARNCAVMDGCALVSTNAGWNLAIGAFPRATGRFETLRSADGCREVTGQVQQDRCWWRYGVSHIMARPGRWLALVPKKLAYTFDHESFAVEYLREARPSAWPETRRLLVRGAATGFHRVLLCAAAFASVTVFWRRAADERARRRARAQVALLAAIGLVTIAGLGAEPPTFWAIAVVAVLVPLLPIPGRPPLEPGLLMCVALLGSTLLTHAIFFGEDRYHVVVTPALALLAASALREQNARGASASAERRG